MPLVTKNEFLNEKVNGRMQLRTRKIYIEDQIARERIPIDAELRRVACRAKRQASSPATQLKGDLARQNHESIA
jgi:hypothetical protein